MGGDISMLAKTESELLVTLSVALFMILLGLILAILTDPYLKKGHRKYLLCASLVVACLVAQGELDVYLGTYEVSRMGRILVAMLGYQLRPLVLTLFIWLLDLEKKRRWLWIPLAANALVYATAPFSSIAFTIHKDYSFGRGPLGFTCHFVSLALLVYLLVLSIQKFGKRKRVERAVPVAITFTIFAAVAADYVQADAQWVSFLTVAMVSSCVFFYIWIHLQFAIEHERAILAEQQMQLTIAQVQPHFLYSALSTIQALCKADPDKAFDITEKFTNYLNENDATLKRRGLIPFSKELEHTKVYAEVEMACFPDFRMEYDIKDDDFLVPALTLQPIVENALRGDERIRAQGLIRVSASREGDYYEIIVWDNGSGFQSNPTKDEEHSYHIDVENVRERIENMCGGTLEVEGFPNDGTIVTIRIPVNAPVKKETEENE
ncbi:MAG: histidine kinase [Lachnospiraceae bacterium]|nr:histidine kinase [Lachnospiraceae bacterium]